MELRHLRYFAAVAGTLNFRLAAERLNLSTPALSKQVKDLEEEVGVRLLDRDTTQVRLTNAGTVFLEETKAILERAERAVQQAREAQRGQRGRLSIGNIGPLTASYMAAALSTYCARFPEVEVDLIDVDFQSQLSALESGMIQLGFLPLQNVASLPAHLGVAPAMLAPLAVAMPEGHPLARRPAVSLKEIAGEKMLTVASLNRQTSHATYITQLLEGRGLKCGRIVEVRGFESLLAMIAGGQGISILAGRRLIHVDNLVMRPLKETGPDIQLDIQAVWRKDAGVLAKNFVEAFREFDKRRSIPAETEPVSEKKTAKRR
ncbi:LysR family transcriptional regulator [Oleiharenicola lentus]|uniref:LysR family transcriptional regulator n=1 Tax=Oleiharenicola lentus TaxID=2508720 RepID=UPI003F676E25